RAPQCLTKVVRRQRCRLQGVRTRAQDLLLTHARVSLRTERDIESALAVDAPKAVKRSPVEVNEPHGSCMRVPRSRVAKTFERSRRHVQCGERPYEPFRVVPERDERIDQLFVCIAKAASPWRRGKIDRPSSNERLEVPAATWQIEDLDKCRS